MQLHWSNTDITETHWSVDLAVPQQLHWSDTDTTETHWSVDLAVPQQLHWSDTDTTETHWSVDLAVHTAVTLVRYGQYRDTLVSRLSCTYSSYTGQIRTIQRHTGQST